MPWFVWLPAFLLAGGHAAGQSFQVPSSWQSNISDSLDQRISFFQSAIDVTMGHYNITSGTFEDNALWGPITAFYADLCLFDRLTNGTKYHDLVLTAMRNLDTKDGFQVLGFPDYVADWGITNMEAYLTYGDAEFVGFAGKVYDYISTFALSQAQADKNKPPVAQNQTGVIKGFCNGLTMAGGVPHETDPNNYGMNGLSTGTYLTLSALLSKSTHNTKYTSSAIQSINFMINQLIAPTSNLVRDGIDPTSCGVSTSIFTYNGGLLIRGLSILNGSGVDGVPGNFSDSLTTLIASTVPYTGWQGDDGILLQSKGLIGGDAYYIRALIEAYTSVPSNSPLKSYLKAYLSNQYNAIRTNALNPASQTYSLQWTGPPPPTGAFNAGNQTAAMAVLIGAIMVDEAVSTQPNPTTAAPGTQTSTGSDDSSSSSSHTGAIVGAVIGSLAGIALASLFIIWILRKRRDERNSNHEGEGGDQERKGTGISPFRLPSRRTRTGRGWSSRGTLYTDVPASSINPPNTEELVISGGVGGGNRMSVESFHMDPSAQQQQQQQQQQQYPGPLPSTPMSRKLQAMNANTTPRGAGGVVPMIPQNPNPSNSNSNSNSNSHSHSQSVGIANTSPSLPRTDTSGSRSGGHGAVAGSGSGSGNGGEERSITTERLMQMLRERIQHGESIPRSQHDGDEEEAPPPDYLSSVPGGQR